jgi:hypothetical protein
MEWATREVFAQKTFRSAALHLLYSAPTFHTYVRLLLGTTKSPVGHMFRKADPDHMLSSGTTYVRIVRGVTKNARPGPPCPVPLPRGSG